MKKLLFALVAVAMLVACKDDTQTNNNNNTPNASIVGTWLGIEYTLSAGSQNYTQNIESDMSIVEFTSTGEAYFSEAGVPSDTANYTLAGSILTLNAAGDQQVLDVTSLTATELKVMYSEFDSTISTNMTMEIKYERQ